jgi:hypothetical protein
MMFNWENLDNLDRLFVIWAFLFQIILIVHYAVRKPFFDKYTIKYGWVVYALCIPALIVSIILWRGGKDWTLWLGGFLFLVFAVFGYWTDYVAQIQFRNPFKPLVGIPYVLIYLATIMFYWWPLWPMSRPLWFVYAILYVIATILNIKSH